MVKAIMTKDKYYLIVRRLSDNKRIRYNLKDFQLEKEKVVRGESLWIPVENQYRFFQGMNRADIQYPDKKFEKLVALVDKLNPGCTSLSTFIDRISQRVYLEAYIAEGLRFEAYAYKDYGYSGYTIRYQGIQQPVTMYDKNILKFFRENDIEITRSIERHYVEEKHKIDKLFFAVQNSELAPDRKRQTFDIIMNGYRGCRENFWHLVNDYGFDSKSLLNYIWNYLVPFEAIEFDDAVHLLNDYYEMAVEMGRKVKKYPKYLRSMHDIITANHRTYKTHYDEMQFAKHIKKELEFEGDGYAIVVPSTTKDVVQEGVSLNHCVSSYVDKIIKGETYIMFLRKKKEKQESLITLEYKDKSIVQARGAYNRSLVEDEMKFLQKYCKKMEINLQV